MATLNLLKWFVLWWVGKLSSYENATLFQTPTVLVNSKVILKYKFNYCSLVQHSSNKIEKIYKRCLRLTLYNYKIDYKTLLDKSGSGIYGN